MQSALHGMIDKAHRYAEEPRRVQIQQMAAIVAGGSGEHQVQLAGGLLRCDCDHHRLEGLCAHVLTVERVLKQHLPPHAVPFPGQRGQAQAQVQAQAGRDG